MWNEASGSLPTPTEHDGGLFEQQQWVSHEN